MKLKEALEIGIDCGLETARECIRNIYIHAPSLFLYSEMNKELNELYTEVGELVSKTNFTTDDKAQYILDWINIEEDGVKYGRIHKQDNVRNLWRDI